MKRLNKKDKLARGEKWANWIRDVKGEIITEGLIEWQLLRRSHKKRFHFAIEYPEKFLVLFELRDKFNEANREVNQKFFNLMYQTSEKVDVLHYQVLIDMVEKYKKYFVSDKADDYILEFQKLPEPKIPLDNFVNN